MNEVSFVAWGPFALFTRPETRSERISHSVPTPSAMRGIADSIIFKPQMRWDILQIAILHPWWIDYQTDYPCTMSLKQNEVKYKMSFREFVSQIKNKEVPRIDPNQDDRRTQRNSLILKDVAYLVAMRPKILIDSRDCNSQKYIEMFKRRASKGQFYTKPYFGCREFACDVSLPRGCERIRTDLNLDCGLMVHHLEYDQHPPRPVLFRAIVRNGILNCDDEIVEIKR